MWEVTSNLKHRVAQHKKKLIDGYTAQYNLFKLVHFEEFGDIRAAIAREKQIKGWLRAKKGHPRRWPKELNVTARRDASRHTNGKVQRLRVPFVKAEEVS